ncbi:MAG: twin-arginine translocase subunit TatC, partial [Planctomycetales bacterium]|nr:twin-arginine translocase subunit TatC [Planctomycetales bacterium]
MPIKNDDDLFRDSTMTFGEHLEELRGALFRSIIGLTIGFLIGCAVADRVVLVIQQPLVEALERYFLSKAKDEVLAKHAGELDAELLRMIDAGYAPDESTMIEPFTILNRMHDAFPEDFPQSYSAHRFSVDDFTVADKDQSQPLARRWSSEGEAASESVGKTLWNRLSELRRAEVKKLAAAETPSFEARRELAAALNGLLDDAQLQAAAPLDRVTDFDHTEVELAVNGLRERLDKGETLPPEDVRRLNRYLITQHFHRLLRPATVSFIPIRTWKRLQVATKALNAQEVFLIWVKAALVAGAVISSPWVFYQIWLFVAAGLYPHEKNYVYLYLPISLGLFLAGAALAFFFVFQPVLDFLFSFNKWMNIDPDPRIGEWLGFVLFLPVGFGVSFQLPLVMLFLNRIGIFSLAMYTEKWRIAVLAIFVISMVLTPADPISMLLMAVPLTVLYFGGILMCRYMPRSRNP